MIKVKYIPSLLSRKGRTEWERQATFDCLVDYVPERYRNKEYRVIHSRHGVISRDEWAMTKVRDGDEVIITPEIKDPGTIFAFFAGAAAGSAAAAAIATAVGALLWIVTAGAFVYSALQARKFKGSRDSGAWEDSPTYGWDGARTMADTELPVQITYGKDHIGGNIISSYLQAVDDLHYLNILLGLGEGPIESIGGITTATDNADISAIADLITINGNPIENYQDVEVFIRMGEDVQTVIPGFDQLQEEFDLTASNIELLKDVAYTYTTTNDDVDSAVISFKLPNGVHFFKAQASGYKSWFVFFKIEFKLHTDAGWTEVDQTFPRGPGDGQDRRAYRQFTDGGYGSQPSGTTWPDTMPVGNGAIYGKTTSQLRRQFTLEFPAPGQYDIRLTRTSANSSSGTPVANADTYVSNLFVQAINERRALGLTYPGTALLGLRVLATDQLSGSFPNIVTEVEGLKVIDWNGGAATYKNNPMSCMWDLLTNERYGAGLYIEAANMDAAIAQDVSDYCDALVYIDGISGAQEKRYLLDVTVDSFRRAMDLIIDLSASFRGMPFYSEGVIKIFQDKPEAPVQMFGMGNIVRGSFSEAFVSLKNRKNRVQVQFIDAAHQYQRDTVEETDEDSLDAGEPVRDWTMFMPGIKRQSHATRIARYMLKLNLLSTRTIAFKAATDAVTCQPGDVIGFAHDVPQWGLASGRVKAGAASIFILKDNVTIPSPPSGSTVVVRMRHPDDSMEEQDVTSAPGDYAAGDTISISPATFDTNPTAYDLFEIGYDTTIQKPFRLMRVARESDYEVPLTAVEYDADIYDESSLLPPADQFSFLPDPRRRPLPVENLTAVQRMGQTPHVLINFDVPQEDNDFGFWDHAEVQLGVFDEDDAVAGPTFDVIGDCRSEPYPIYDLTPGRDYRVRVVSVSKWGVRENLVDASTVDFIHGFEYESLPPIVRGLEIITQGNDDEFKAADAVFEWRPARSFESAHNPVGEEPLGAGQGTEDYWFQDYKVEIYTRNALRRTIFVKDPAFTYTRDMNFEDNKDFHATDYLQSPVAKVVTILVWVRDIFNRLSSRPAILVVNNSAPAPIGGWDLAVVAPVTSADYFSEVEDLGGGNYRLSWQQSQEVDVAGYRIYRRLHATDNVPMDATDGQPVDDTYFLLDSDGLMITGLLQDAERHRFVIAPFDSFQRDLINYRRHIVVSYDVGPGVAVDEDVIWPQSQEPDIPRY